MVLMTIQTKYGKFLRIPGPFNTWNILICLATCISLYMLLILQIVKKNVYESIAFSCFWILKTVFIRIKTAIHEHIKFFYMCFIEPVICNSFSIGRPMETTGKSKFLFINPIGSSINNFIILTIGSYLVFCSRFNICNKDVIISYKCNPTAIR